MITIESSPSMDPCWSCGVHTTQCLVLTRRLTDVHVCEQCLAEFKAKLCVGMVPEQAHARRTDPDTSRLAAASVNVTKGQERVLSVIRVCFPLETFTLDQLVDGA